MRFLLRLDIPHHLWHFAQHTVSTMRVMRSAGVYNCLSTARLHVSEPFVDFQEPVSQKNGIAINRPCCESCPKVAIRISHVQTTWCRCPSRASSGIQSPRFGLEVFRFSHTAILSVRIMHPATSLVTGRGRMWRKRSSVKIDWLCKSFGFDC